MLVPAGACTLEQFGAVGDGVTSDQAAYSSAAAACAAGEYGALILGAKTYVISPTIGTPWPMGVSVIGCGGASVINITSNASAFLIRDTSSTKRSESQTLFANFRVKGNSTGASQNGIKVGYLGSDGSSHVKVSNVTCHHLGGIGFAMAFSEDVASGQMLDCCEAYNCTTGFALQQATATNIKAIGCTLGVDVLAGNVNIAGGIARNCPTGAWIRAGGNDTHGSFSSFQFLHNTTALRVASGIVNGHAFSGCLFYEGTMLFDGRGAAVTFTGGQMDLGIYTLGDVRMIGVTMNTNYYNSATKLDDAIATFTDCKKIDGTDVPWISTL